MLLHQGFIQDFFIWGGGNIGAQLHIAPPLSPNAYCNLGPDLNFEVLTSFGYFQITLGCTIVTFLSHCI